MRRFGTSRPLPPRLAKSPFCGRYRAGLAPLRDHYLFVELWNTEEKHPAHQADLRRVRRALPLKQKCAYAAKRLLPRRWIDALKRRKG